MSMQIAELRVQNPVIIFSTYNLCPSSCFCSSVSTDCHPSTSHYWSTLRLPVYQVMEDLAVVDREGRDLGVSLQLKEDSQASQILSH